MGKTNSRAGYTSEASMAQVSSKVSKMSSLSSRSPYSLMRSSTSSQAPPTVQALQAGLAQAVLEQSGIYRSTSHTDSDAASQSHKKVVRIVPEPEETIRHAPPARLPSGTLEELMSDSRTGEVDAQMRNAKSSASVWSQHEVRRMTSSQVLQLRFHEIAMQASHSSLPTIGIPDLGGESQDTASSEKAVPYTLLVFGVLPWSVARWPRTSMAYQWFVRALVTVAVTVFFLPSLGSVVPPTVRDIVFPPDCVANGVVCYQREGFLSLMPLPVGAILVLLPVAFRRHQEALEETFMLLRGVSLERRYQDWHQRKAKWDRITFAGIWFCTVLSTIVSHYATWEFREASSASQVVMHAVLNGVFSGVILSLAYGMAYICRSLNIMIDAFCCDVVGHQVPQEVSRVWNLTQAVLRKASISVEKSLLVLCVVLAFIVPLLLVDVGILGTRSAPIPRLLPGLMVTIGVLYVLMLAGTISEQCARVPALINAISFGEGMERARQDTVDYITSSAAGFYVFGMRLTTGVIVKFMYFWCIVVVGLLTRMGPSGET